MSTPQIDQQLAQQEVTQKAIQENFSSKAFKGLVGKPASVPAGFIRPTSAAGLVELQTLGNKVLQESLNVVQAHPSIVLTGQDWIPIAAALTSSTTVAGLMRYLGHSKRCKGCTSHGAENPVGESDAGGCFRLYIGSFCSSHAKGHLRLKPWLQDTFFFLARTALQALQEMWPELKSAKSSDTRKTKKLKLDSTNILRATLPPLPVQSTSDLSTSALSRTFKRKRQHHFADVKSVKRRSLEPSSPHSGTIKTVTVLPCSERLFLPGSSEEPDSPLESNPRTSRSPSRTEFFSPRSVERSSPHSGTIKTAAVPPGSERLFLPGSSEEPESLGRAPHLTRTLYPQYRLLAPSSQP
ncbi:hypothetical protein C8R45DRAFT_926561 [Mycena sanguinolenta]|nr:hypothetical protein C8R45DRAFT_926561 [Mycena sanguinolenta]